LRQRFGNARDPGEHQNRNLFGLLLDTAGRIERFKNKYSKKPAAK
jgi:hypothetical protein